jgi:hypothetical protein
MSFPGPPPPQYKPPQNKTLYAIVATIVVIVIIVIAIVLYLGIRRVYKTGCTSDLQCLGTETSKCNKDLKICVECLKTSDCDTGLTCSTANTCV